MFCDPRFVEFDGRVFVQQHGSPFDRGSADSYYHRARSPHWYPEGTGHGIRIEADDMTPEEIQAYHAGYDHNERFGDKKDWG